MKNMKFLLVSLMLLSFLNASAKEDLDLLCEQKPQANVVVKIPSPSSNPCDAKAKIQAKAYECGSATDTFEFAKEALAENIEKAQDLCETYCEGISSSCTGKFDKPFACGLSTPTNRSIEIGRDQIGCPKHCKGQAFNYCSIYHASFFGTEAHLFKNMNPNCHCRKK